MVLNNRINITLCLNLNINTIIYSGQKKKTTSEMLKHYIRLSVHPKFNIRIREKKKDAKPGLIKLQLFLHIKG